MQIFPIILFLCSLSCSANGFVFPPDDEVGETMIQRHGNGSCTYEITKQEFVPVEVTYNDIQTHYGRCRGNFFRKCINERLVTKTRFEHQFKAKTETILKCCAGYISIITSGNNKCVPICQEICHFGTCTAPDVCTCMDGYVRKANLTHVCEPQCVGCDHGTCIAPNLCQCAQGYDWDLEKKECIPFCSGNCHNGKCIAPEQCSCNEGYIHHERESFCIPHCENGCTNGLCMEPNKCECFESYRMMNETIGYCEPICEIECINSKCVEPNTCECHSGYIVHDDDKPHECSCGKYCVEVDGKCHCLDENQRVSVQQLLNDTAICSKSNCINGYCAAPNHCVCFDGFEIDEHFVCVPSNETCVDDPTLCNGTEIQSCDCLNGICSSDGVCVCLNGFKMVAGHNDRCEPHCSKECIHGICVDPDTCVCENEADYHIGYNATEWNICYPICDRDVDDINGCYNGTCIAPGICECFEGFQLDVHVNFSCIPVPFYAEKSKSSSFGTWSISIILLVIIIVGGAYGAYFVFQKQKRKNFNAHANYDDPTRPIACEPSEEL